MEKDDDIDLEEANKIARQRFLESISDQIKEAYNNEIVSALSKKFGINDQNLLQNHLYLAGHIYLHRKSVRTVSRTDARGDMVAISKKAKALIKQLEKLDSDVRNYLDIAGSLTFQQCMTELGREPEDRPIHRDLGLPRESETYPWPALEGIETALGSGPIKCFERLG